MVPIKGLRGRLSSLWKIERFNTRKFSVAREYSCAIDEIIGLTLYEAVLCVVILNLHVLVHPNKTLQEIVKDRYAKVHDMGLRDGEPQDVQEVL